MSNDIDEGVQDTWTPYVDEPDELNIGGIDDAAGTDSYESPLLAHPDQAPYAELLTQIVTSIREAIDKERKYFANIESNVVRVNPNSSGAVLFQRYSVPTVPIQIVREKLERGDITLVNSSGGTVSIGLHAGIIAGGTDTVSLAVGASRTIRTRMALWAIASAQAEIDVQEEFG